MKIEDDIFTGTLDELIEYFFKNYGDKIAEMEDKQMEEYLKAHPEALKAADDFYNKTKLSASRRRHHFFRTKN